MKKKTSVIVLMLLIPTVVLMHVSWRHEDNGLLFNVDGRDVDVVGAFTDWARTATNRCQMVHALPSDDPRLGRIQAVIQSYSPPDSMEIRDIHVWTTSHWAIAEVEFQQLLPAVITLRDVDTDHPAVVEGAIWSGATAPWKSGPRIRSYLKSRSSDTPQDLLDCFEFQTKHFR